MWTRNNLKCDVCGKITCLRLHIAGSPRQEISFTCDNCKTTLGGILELDYENSGTKFKPFSCKFTSHNEKADYFIDHSEAFPSAGVNENGHSFPSPFLRHFADFEKKSKSPSIFIRKPIEKEWFSLTSLQDTYLNSDLDNFSILSKDFLTETILKYKNHDMYSMMYAIQFWFFGEFINLDETLDYLNDIDDYISIDDLKEQKQQSLFFKELEDNNYFNKLTKEIFVIFNRFGKENHLLRPALFYEKGSISINDKYVSNESFVSIRSLYTDTFETLGRLLTISYGLESIRNKSHNLQQKTWEDFMKTDQGNKFKFITNPLWTKIYRDAFNNQIRNGINHHKAFINKETQMITYYPSKNNMDKFKQIQYIDFLHITLKEFRTLFEMWYLLLCCKVYPNSLLTNL